MDEDFDSIDIVSIKEKKIKYIYTFFEKKYSDEISNKILTIINILVEEVHVICHKTFYI